MKMTPEDFYYNFVKENFDDFIEKEECVRRGFNAAVAVFHMADHYYNYCKRNAPEKVKRFPKIKDYYVYLSQKNQYFQDIQGIANAYKHLYQRKPGAPYVTINSAGSIESVSAHNLKIELDESQKYVAYCNTKSGERIRLSVALKSVIEMWKLELEVLGK
jgi:hypothetical protein